MLAPDTLAARLRRLRTAAGLSQGTLARRVGLSTSYISLLENDQRQPSMPVLHRLAAYFSVEPVFLRYGTDLCGAQRAQLQRRAATQRVVMDMIRNVFAECSLGDTVTWEYHTIAKGDKHVTTITLIKETGDRLLDGIGS
jgi:transcriptional regulator with XRE-family HTH domain